MLLRPGLSLLLTIVWSLDGLFSAFAAASPLCRVTLEQAGDFSEPAPRPTWLQNQRAQLLAEPGLEQIHSYDFDGTLGLRMAAAERSGIQFYRSPQLKFTAL